MLCQSKLLVVVVLMLVMQEEREPLRDQLVCFLIHYAAEYNSEDVLEAVFEAVKDGRVHVGTHVVNKLLVCSLLISKWHIFHTTARSYASEPSVKLFSVLNRALVSSAVLVDDFEPGLEELLKKLFTSKRLPDAMLAMETPGHVKSNPGGFIATFIDNHFYEIERGLGPGARLLGFQEAGAVIRICTLYQDGFDRAKQSVLLCPVFASLDHAHTSI